MMTSMRRFMARPISLALDASGRMEIYKGVGSVMMPNETDVWPIYKLKPIRMLDAYLIRGDMDFGYGKILKDFNT